MLSRFRSIVWKFPILMFALVMVTAGLFVMAAYSRFSRTLYQTAGQRLGVAGKLVADLVGAGSPRVLERMSGIARNPSVSRFLQTGADSAAAHAALLSDKQPQSDTSRIRMQLLDHNGRSRIDAKVLAGPYANWAEANIASGRLDSAAVTYSPMLAVTSKAEYQLVTPVRSSRSISDPPIGYVVDTRRVSGTGGDAVRGLIGDGTTMIIGSPREGAWTDLSGLSEGPPPGYVLGKPFVFSHSTRGPGIGVATPIKGTPWVVWVQHPSNFVTAPLRQFAWGLLPSATVIGILGALLVWLLSRRVTDRIMRLSDQLDQLHPGETTELAGGKDTSDEIDRLQHSFNRMAARLEHQRQLESDLRQSQKLEAVGRLAGGVAHDFNNLLTVIRNYSELVREELPKDGPLVRDIDEVIRATVRATDLTSQLLSFSRHKVVEPQVLNVNQVVEGAMKMLRRVVPSNIEFTTELSEDAGKIKADSGQVEQVLLNLTINAADAMPQGGRITIRTGRGQLDSSFDSDGSDTPAREYACLTVTDTGQGMDPETARRIFEPFFTTKDVGKGTGLGLATVHGIVKGAGGRIWVYSEPQLGTTFKIYFPRVDAEENASSETRFPTDEPESLRGTETVLLVEDEPSTREVIQRILEKRGYTVVGAGNGLAALEEIKRNDDIKLVITDLMLPEIDGASLAGRIRETHPDVAIVMISGYSEHEITKRKLHDGNYRFIEKPFTAATLLRVAREALRVA